MGWDPGKTVKETTSKDPVGNKVKIGNWTPSDSVADETSSWVHGRPGSGVATAFDENAKSFQNTTVNGKNVDAKDLTPSGFHKFVKNQIEAGNRGGGSGGGSAVTPQGDPRWITAPQYDQSQFNFTPGTSQGPASFTGAQIRQVSDPRQVLIDPTQQAQFRQQQQGLISQLSDQASGRGPSVAATQLLQAQQANQAAAFAQLASARGQGNPALARQTMLTSSNLQAQTARDSAVARMQEQMNAQQQLGGVLSGARGQDITMATQQAQIDSAASLEAYKGQLQMAVQQGQIDQSTAELQFKAAQDRASQNLSTSTAMQQQYNTIKMQYLQMGMSADQANQAAALAVAGANQGAQYQSYQAQIAAQQAANQKKADLYKAGATGAGVVATMYGGPAAGAATKTAGDQLAEKQAAKDEQASADNESLRESQQSDPNFRGPSY